MTIALIILLAVPPVVAVMAAVRDLTTMTIPNWMSLVLAALFLPAALVAGLEWLSLLTHLGLGAAATPSSWRVSASGCVWRARRSSCSGPPSSAACSAWR